MRSYIYTNSQGKTVEIHNIADSLYVMLAKTRTYDVSILVCGTSVEAMKARVGTQYGEYWKIFDISVPEFDAELSEWLGPTFKLHMTDIISRMRQTIQKVVR